MESVLVDIGISEPRSVRVVDMGCGIITAEHEVLLKRLPTNQKYRSRFKEIDSMTQHVHCQ